MCMCVCGGGVHFDVSQYAFVTLSLYRNIVAELIIII